jgi:hypothetical protein
VSASTRALRKKQASEQPASIPTGVPAGQRDAALLGSVQAATSGPGQSLDPVVAEQMGARFGHDFGSVRVHTDDQAAASASTFEARAYTVGSDLVFGAGEYAPTTNEGQQLIAHELAHVVQQSSMPAPAPPQAKGLIVSQPGDPFEEAADAAAEAALANDPLEKEPQAIAAPPADTAPLVQRKAAVGEELSLDDAAAAAVEETSDADAEAEQAAVEVAEPVPLANAPGEDGGEGGAGGSAPPPAPPDPPTAPPVPLVAAPPAPEAKTEPVPVAAPEIPAFNPAALLPLPAVPAIPTPPPAPASPLPSTAAGMESSAGAMAPPANGMAGDPSGQQVGDAAGVPGGVMNGVSAAIGAAANGPTNAISGVAEGVETAIAAAGDTAGAAPPPAAAAAGATPTAAAAGATPAATPAPAPTPAAPAATPAPAASAPTATPAPSATPTAQAGGGGGGGGGAATGDRAPASPEEDPAFGAVAGRAAGVAAQQSSHAPAGSVAGAAQAAADPGGSDVAMAAQGRQVSEIEAQPAAAFDAVGFKNKLMEKIAQSAPKNLEEADEFKNNNELGAIKGELGSDVKGEKDRATGPVAEKAAQAPETSGINPKAVQPLPGPATNPAPAPIGAEAAAPKPKSDGEVSDPYKAASGSIDQQMGEANVTEKQLEKGNEPAFNDALGAKKEAQSDAAAKPGQTRQQEGAVLEKAQAEAGMTAEQKAQAMAQERTQLLAEVFGMQGETKGADEQKRREVAEHIAGIYQQTRDETEKILNELGPWCEQRFSQGADAAKAVFEKYVGERMDKYKDERYDGVTGAAQWLSDKLFGMPEEVNVFYVEGRNLYLAEMDKVITEVSEHVAAELNRAKARVAEGRKAIQDYVATLSPELQQVGQQAAGQIQDKFNQLEQSVSDKQGELVDSLAQKYNEKLKEVDERIAALQAENRGLVDKALDAVGGAIKTILEIKDMLLNTLQRAADAVMKIIEDPIGFLSNLLDAVKQGLMQFVGNIGSHLQTGLLEWLTGTVAATGLKMPAQLDLPGIFDLVLQILGLTKENIRAQIVKALGPSGEMVMGALEKGWEVLQILASGGLAALWEYVKDQVGDLYAMVVEQIKTMITEEVVKAGIQWIIGLLGGPAGAFVKAAQAIIKIVMWFVENGSRMMSLVNAIIDGVNAIAGGAIGSAANFVENALAKALPMAISFLASLLGLGNIAQKVQDIIAKVQAPVNKAIDWVVKKALAMGKKLLGKFKSNKGDDTKVEEGEGEEDPEKKAKFDAGIAAVQALPEQSEDEIGQSLGKIKGEYGFDELGYKDDGEDWKIHAVMRMAKTPKVGKKGDAGKSRSELEKSIKSWKEELQAHEDKLAAYIADPDAFDNKGFLKNAPTPEIRQRIIDGRIRHLNEEIENFKKQIAEAEAEIAKLT